MFKAMLLLCFVVNQQQCITAIDNRGPYKTIGQCNDRLAEMTMDIMNDPRTAGQFIISEGMCVEMMGTKTKTSILSDLGV